MEGEYGRWWGGNDTPNAGPRRHQAAASTATEPTERLARPEEMHDSTAARVEGGQVQLVQVLALVRALVLEMLPLVYVVLMLLVQLLPPPPPPPPPPVGLLTATATATATAAAVAVATATCDLGPAVMVPFASPTSGSLAVEGVILIKVSAMRRLQAAVHELSLMSCVWADWSVERVRVSRASSSGAAQQAVVNELSLMSCVCADWSVARVLFIFGVVLERLGASPRVVLDSYLFLELF